MKALRIVVAIGVACVWLMPGAAATAANPDHVDQLKGTHQCPSCDLSAAELNGLRLDNADLSGANLFGAQLYGASLRGANLASAIFQEANLRLANLSGAKDAVLTGAFTDARTICPDGANGPCN